MHIENKTSNTHITQCKHLGYLKFRASSKFLLAFQCTDSIVWYIDIVMLHISVLHSLLYLHSYLLVCYSICCEDGTPHISVLNYFVLHLHYFYRLNNFVIVSYLPKVTPIPSNIHIWVWLLKQWCGLFWHCF